MPLTRRRFSQSLLGAGAVGSLGPFAGCAGGAAPGGDGFESLDAIARRKGMRFGNAMGITASGQRGSSRFHDTAYRELVARECGMLVAENETKWQHLAPRQGVYDFAAADEMFAWARSRGMLIRGHTLIWQDPKWLPQWVNQHDFGSRPALESERLLREHVDRTCSHFGNDVISWDVVNEAVDPETGALRKNVFSARIGGHEQMALMFELARQYAPHAQLVYNDYMNWGGGNATHRDGVIKLLQDLKRRGAPVHALGLQAHIGSWAESRGNADNRAQEREWRQFLDEVSGIGLELLVTEFDAHDRYLPADIATRDAAVAAAAREWLDVTLSYPRLRSFLTWGLADHVSWLQDGWPRSDGLPKRPTPYDEQLRPKPLRQALADAFRAMPARTAA